MSGRYLTTPIYYVNAEPHIGHAYTNLATDTLARYYRLCGEEVYFLTGTDEYGEKIQRTAEEKGVSPQELVDDVVVTFEQLWEDLGISHDGFIRTTDPEHETAVQHLFSQLKEQGDIYLDTYEGPYCVPCETHWTEGQLEEESCPDCGREIEYLEEESYFFRISDYLPRLNSFLEENPDWVRPAHRLNEVRQMIENNEGDLSISRTRFDWGIPVPGDENHIIYVWFDALINYLSGIGFPDESYKNWWPAEVHVIGKDILRFHGVIWPCMLMAAGIELPRRIHAHGWWTIEGEKISKSKGNAVDPRDLADQYGREALRFFLLRQIPFGEDGTLSDDAMIDTINGNLANDLGNLVNRILSMIEQYRDGTVPKTDDKKIDLADSARETRRQFRNHMEEMEFDRAIRSAFEWIGEVNGWIQEKAPWELAGDEEQEETLNHILYHAAESLNEIAYLLAPIMPETAETIRDRLGHEFKQDLTNRQWGELDGGEATSKGSPLFPRIET